MRIFHKRLKPRTKAALLVAWIALDEIADTGKLTPDILNDLKTARPHIASLFS